MERLNTFNLNQTLLLQLLQLNGRLKVIQDHLSPKLAVDPEFSNKMIPDIPHVLGLIVECRPIEAVPSILELEVPQISFTSTVGLDMKIQSVDTE